MTDYSTNEYMKAHQYLYYCMGEPVLSDYDYDDWCNKYNLDGKGGSDLESSYSNREKELAKQIYNRKINPIPNN